MMPPNASGCESPLINKAREHKNGLNDIIKCVLVGDGGVGKTSLIVSYSTNKFPKDYIPTAYDKYNVEVSVDGRRVGVQLCDTAGQNDFDPLRTLCYPEADVFMVCFSIMSSTSFENVKEKWIPEIRCYCPGAAIILVGTQNDLRNNSQVQYQMSRRRMKTVSVSSARELALKIDAAAYVETSALTQRDLKEAFDEAIISALTSKEKTFSRCNRNSQTKYENKQRSVWKQMCCCGKK
uniref:Uncharacterized protein n=1 Tax=Timema monikensis TaxID=170555 RepID=A0A7R9E7J4_9NEOP|nr:unnamed protein product [Timema monikensis]